VKMLTQQSYQHYNDIVNRGEVTQFTN
jgi:hypothetical protein